MTDTPYPSDGWWAARITISPDGCWLWNRYVNMDGYPRVSINRVRKMAHRLSYEQHVGSIPEGYQVDHLCRIRHCVNPMHLQAVTPRENVLRSMGISAQVVRSGWCVRGLHRMEGDNVYMRPNGCRYCRACKRRREQERYRAQKVPAR